MQTRTQSWEAAQPRHESAGVHLTSQHVSHRKHEAAIAQCDELELELELEIEL